LVSSFIAHSPAMLENTPENVAERTEFAQYIRKINNNQLSRHSSPLQLLKQGIEQTKNNCSCFSNRLQGRSTTFKKLREQTGDSISFSDNAPESTVKNRNAQNSSEPHFLLVDSHYRSQFLGISILSEPLCQSLQQRFARPMNFRQTKKVKLFNFEYRDEKMLFPCYSGEKVPYLGQAVILKKKSFPIFNFGSFSANLINVIKHLSITKLKGSVVDKHYAKAIAVTSSYNNQTIKATSLSDRIFSKLTSFLKCSTQTDQRIYLAHLECKEIDMKCIEEDYVFL
ncbi:MAG: hypothetical protein MHPSP_002588, partial [Paramarteilia canceri]